MATKKKVPRGRAWIKQIFKAAQASKAGVLRRAVKSVQKQASEQDLVDEAKARGFRVMKIGDQYVVICNTNVLVLVP
jgi:hypothetical protein